MSVKNDRAADHEEMARRLASDTFLISAISAAVREAVREHKRAGNAVAYWQNGRVVVVAPEDIQIPDHENTASAAK